MLHLHDSIIVIANMALEEKSSNEKGARWSQFFLFNSKVCYAHHKILGSMWWSHVKTFRECVKVMWEDFFCFCLNFHFLIEMFGDTIVRRNFVKKLDECAKGIKLHEEWRKINCVNKCLRKKLGCKSPYNSLCWKLCF